MFSKSSLRVRLTMLYVVIFGGTLVVFSTLLYKAFQNGNQNLFDAELYNYAIDVSESIDVDFFNEVTISGNPLARRGKVFLYAIGNTYMQVRSFEGGVLAASRNLAAYHLPLTDADRRLLKKVGFSLSTLEKDLVPPVPGKTSSAYRMISYVVQKVPHDRYILQLAVPLTILEKESSGLLFFFLLGIPAALVLAAFGGFYLSAKAMAPVGDIIAKAQELSSANLSERLPVPRTDDELRALSLTLNELLDRLEKGFSRQEQFVANASHELRTPLAILRGELDLLKSPHGNAQQQDVDAFLVSASQEIERLSRLVEDLLILARADLGKGFLTMVRVRLDELAIEACAVLEKVTHPGRVKIRLDLKNSAGPEANGVGDYEVKGDPDLLFSLMRNLIQNAVKFSPLSGIVTVELYDSGPDVILKVRDQGAGIAPEVLPKIFDRFYRGSKGQNEATAKSAEKKDIPGFGLGLAIVRQIVEAHQGIIEAKSSPMGTLFEVRLKKG